MVIQFINKSSHVHWLDKDTIKSEIMPHLSTAKRGYITKSDLVVVVNAILYKLKTGCQWKFLPVKYGVIPNICINRRRTDADDILVDGMLYAERYSI